MYIDGCVLIVSVVLAHKLNEKNDAPMVGRTLSENVPPRFLTTMDVLPTPKREREREESSREREGG